MRLSEGSNLDLSSAPFMGLTLFLSRNTGFAKPKSGSAKTRLVASQKEKSGQRKTIISFPNMSVVTAACAPASVYNVHNIMPATLKRFVVNTFCKDILNVHRKLL